MKKQILILILAILAICFSSTAFAQLAPRPVTCLTPDALHPIAGQPYTYEVNVPTPDGTKEYLWFVTQDPAFMAAGTLTANRAVIGGPILAAGSGHYNLLTADANSISLTWQSFAYDPTNPVFVVIQVVNTAPADDGGCVSENLKVYKIEPANAFTLDIANRTADNSALETGYGTNVNRCLSGLVSATYDPAAPEGVLYDFGENVLYYEMTAANWSEAYNFSLQLTNIDPLEHVTVEWAYTSDFAGAVTMTGPANGTGAIPATYTNTVNVVPPASATFVGPDGQSIYIRVTLDHSVAGVASWQGLTAQNIALAVDAVTVPTTGTGVGDVHTEAGTNPGEECPWVDLYAHDIAYQTLQARPDIQSTTVGVAPNPNPAPFLIVEP